MFDNIWGKDIPAWSLSRLLEMMPQYIDEKETILLMIEPPMIMYYDTKYNGEYHFTSSPDIFEDCVSMIEWLIRNHPEILEEKE